MAQSGMVTDSIVQHYEEAAKGGAGLIIVNPPRSKGKARRLWNSAPVERRTSRGKSAL